MSAPPNVKISLQSLSEHKIKEISYDGRETFIKPLNMSESLTDLANRIDFLSVDDNTPSKVEETEEVKPVQQTKQWPWQNIHTHLSRALIEMNVLVDVLSIAQNKQTITKENTTENAEASRYLMYDVAVKEQEQLKPALQMVTKKKCLLSAAKILLSGADRLSKAWSEATLQINFHSELLKLRQRWRIRRVGDKIVGDLSYRTAGSDFWHNGAFEVIKRSPDDDTDDDEELQPKVKQLAITPLLRSPVRVVVSADLHGHSSISVSITNLSSQKTAEESCAISYNDIAFLQTSLTRQTDPVWHRKLCNAQNVLFCRELFVRLTKEAIQYRSSGIAAPFVVIGDSISTHIFNHTKLTVRLLNSKKAVTRNQSSKANENLHSLKHALLQLLQAFHLKRLNVSAPHPTSAVLGLNPKMRQAAVKPWSSRQLNSCFKQDSESLAESLVKMAKHHEIRRRLTSVIDSLTDHFQDPDIQAHWSMVGNVYESSVRVTIASSGFESCYRTVVQLTAKTNEIKALQREGKVSSLSVEIPSIYRYFISLISMHQLLTLEALARILHWNLLQVTPHNCTGTTPESINRGTLLVSSPPGNSNVAIACSTRTNGSIDYNVQVQYSKLSDTKLDFINKNKESLTLESPKYFALGGAWHQVDWKSIQGKHFVQKMETLLICLS